ncbi:MAG TPA: nuclear transport factor 2 family protein, partial [Candidatus Dormibacteraeota bacterium]|nr:nuclear transport factor 2 family protein [Candidatus Dormibacteraeota bacterium]
RAHPRAGGRLHVHERIRGLVDDYMSAWERADVSAIVDLLTDDATITMPPRPTWFRGKEDIAAFLSERIVPDSRWRLVPAIASGQLAFGNYGWDDERDRWVLHLVNVLTVSERGIEDTTAFLDADVLRLFGLPPELES